MPGNMSFLYASMIEAKEQNIPVVAYDRIINGTDAVSAFVTYDSYAVGKMQGESIYIDDVAYTVQTWLDEMGITRVTMTLPESW